MSQPDPVLRPVDGGRRPQSVVEYVGVRRGASYYRGRGSGRSYRFAATVWHSRQYVLDEDLELFRSHTEFVVHDAGRIGSEMERLRDEVTLLREQVAQGPREPDRRRPSSRKGGRPRVPDEKLQLMWHLHHHVARQRSYQELADCFLDEDGVYKNAPRAVAAQLYRYRDRAPGPLAEDACPSCAAGIE